jgi:hypothetical protein
MPDMCEECMNDGESDIDDLPEEWVETEEGQVLAYYECNQGHEWTRYWDKYLDKYETAEIKGKPILFSPSLQVPPRRSTATTQGVIYVARCVDRYKIGFTSGSADARIKSLQTGNPEMITLVGTIPGSPAEESNLHVKFHRKRVRGEWFTLTSEDIQSILGGEGE